MLLKQKNLILLTLFVFVIYTLYMFVSHSTKAIESSTIHQKKFQEQTKNVAILDEIKTNAINAEIEEKQKQFENSGPRYMTVTVYESTNCRKDKHFAIIEPEKECDCFDMCNHKFSFDGYDWSSGDRIQSIRVEGKGDLDLYSQCNKGKDSESGYWATIMPSDGCVKMSRWPKIRYLKFEKSSLYAVNSLYGTLPVSRYKHHSSIGKYNVVNSAESSTYMGYQAQTGYYAFLHSNQAKGAVFTRLLTSSELDDMAEVIPTFQAKRHPFSLKYTPFNKADVIDKWYRSAEPPKEKVVIVIDPDNWLLQNLEPIVNQVRQGHAIAQKAWFGFNALRPVITKLWGEFCENNCDWHLDMSAVPYFVHRDDLAVIAPLWKHYTLKIKEQEMHDSALRNRYDNIQLGWCAEMYGYVFAAAHAGIRHEIKNNLQVRDVEGSPSKRSIPQILMLHMGRAWFPKNYEPGKKWLHTEGKQFSHGRNQVWCKCNKTASDIIPWPVPPGTDFQSNATLVLLHNAREMFGHIPINKYRKNYQHGYHIPFP